MFFTEDLASRELLAGHGVVVEAPTAVILDNG